MKRATTLINRLIKPPPWYVVPPADVGFGIVFGCDLFCWKPGFLAVRFALLHISFELMCFAGGHWFEAWIY